MKTPPSHPRRMLMTADTVGGVWNFAIELCRQLGDMEILLATMGRAPSDSQRSQAAELPNVCLLESGFHLEWMDDPWTDVDLAGEWLLELAADFKADLIHLNGYVHAALPFSAPVMVTAHSCVLSWWRAVRGTPLPDSWNEYKRRVSAGLHAADEVVAPTAAMMREIHQHYGTPRHARIIYNGIGEINIMAPQFGKMPMFLCVGRLWDEAKNIGALAEIADLLPWPVTLAGDPGRDAGKWSDVPNFRLAGHLPPEELMELYRNAAVYVHPAKYEPFGLAVLEAALAGCALVLGDIPTLREIWGEAAIYVDPRQPEEMLRTLHDLAADPARCMALGALARSRAGDFSATRMARGYRSAYGEMLTENPQPALP